MNETTDVAIVGAGMIGAAVAWRCAQRGLRVTMIDPEPARGAWNTAAGLLAPITELQYDETQLLRLNVESARRYPDFEAELRDATGLPTGYARRGTLAVAWDAADLAALRDLHAFGRTLGVDAELLTPTELRALEPALVPGLPGGMLAAGDHQVTPRLLHAALLTAAQSCGATVLATTAAVTTSADRVTGVRLQDGSQLDAPTVVLAAGAWSGLVEGVPESARPPVRPVKGQTVRLRLAASAIEHVVRATVKGNPIYLVPREDGEIVLGASVEEAGFDMTPRAGAVYELLRDAQTVLPELGEAQLLEVCTGLRPGSADNAPHIGPCDIAGLVMATGHYRNGVLLAPITADTVAEFVASGVVADEISAFSPLRAKAVRA
jgi:glycine oxidase